MECSVCLSDETRALKLCCGHPICQDCLYKWYMKSASLDKDATCPLCRAPVDFPGFSSMREEWREAAYNSRLDDIFGEAIDELAEMVFEDRKEMEEMFGPQIAAYMDRQVTEALKRIQMTLRVCREEGWDLDEVDWLLHDTDVFFSDRHLDKVDYFDEPPKPFQSRYTQTGHQALSSKRCRARQDPWFTVSFIFEL